MDRWASGTALIGDRATANSRRDRLVRILAPAVAKTISTTMAPLLVSRHLNKSPIFVAKNVTVAFTRPDEDRSMSLLGDKRMLN